MNQTDIVARTSGYLSTFLEKEGFVLLKTEYVKEDGVNYLRAYIDLTDKEREKRRVKAEEDQRKKEEEQPDVSETPEDLLEEEDVEPFSEEVPEPGIGINDCALVSRRLSKWLDKEDFIPDEYMLEVCSKGYLNE